MLQANGWSATLNAKKKCKAGNTRANHPDLTIFRHSWGLTRCLGNIVNGAFRIHIDIKITNICDKPTKGLHPICNVVLCVATVASLCKFTLDYKFGSAFISNTKNVH